MTTDPDSWGRVRRAAVIVAVCAWAAGVVLGYTTNTLIGLALALAPLALVWLYILANCAALVARWVWHGTTSR